MNEARRWRAAWIGYRYDPAEDLGFFEFQLEFDLESAPSRMLVHASADARYTLLANGRICLRGPQRGDLRHWHYESLDLAPFLQPGPNRLLVEVTNFGWMAPMAQHSARTAFLLEAEDRPELSTPGSWKVRRRTDRSFAMLHDEVGPFYIDVGPGEVFHCGPEGCAEPWSDPHRISHAEARGTPSGGTPWNLIPRTLPLESYGTEASPTRATLRRDGGSRRMGSAPWQLRRGDELLLDFGELVVGYPALWLSHGGPMHGELRLVYAESLVDAEGKKGDRSAIEGKSAKGYADLVRLEGADHASIHPSWLRTFRYVSLRADADLDVCAFEAFRAGYPLEVDASFRSSDESLPPIWEQSVRTLRLCAGETYYDCPYYEQLAYIGDTRLQALIGYFLSADRRLQRTAIDQFHWSMLENGLTQSRYPSRQMQVIPPFSLWWVVMLYDAWMHDPGFEPNGYLDAARGAISAYRRILAGDLEPFWCFGDWVPNWPWGIPPGGPRAEMHRILLGMAEWCLGRIEGSEIRPERPPRGPGEAQTEHAESLWRYWQRLAGLVPDPWPESGLEGAEKCTYFWKYVQHVGMAPEDYVRLLEPWKDMIALGLSTTPETPEPTRSDCHGWSAHPPLGLLQLVAGVTSVEPGWARCRIEPRPGALSNFQAVIPHPRGILRVAWDGRGYDVECPIPFDFANKGQVETRPAGRHRFDSRR